MSPDGLFCIILVIIASAAFLDFKATQNRERERRIEKAKMEFVADLQERNRIMEDTNGQ